MLDIDIPTFIFSAINLVVIYVILKKILFVPVSKFLDKRRNAITEEFASAARRKEEAEALLKEYRELLRKAEKTAEELRAETMRKAGEEYARILADAGREADRIRHEGYREIEKEKEALEKDIKAQVARLSILIATRLLKENMDTDRNNMLVDEFLKSGEVA